VTGDEHGDGVLRKNDYASPMVHELADGRAANVGWLQFVDGSHEWDVAGADLDFQKVVARLRRGQVSFHNCRTIRGSGPDRTGRNYADLRFCPELYP
jgi:hypothetical protein